VHGVSIDTVTVHRNGAYVRETPVFSLAKMANKAGVSRICYRCLYDRRSVRVIGKCTASVYKHRHFTPERSVCTGRDRTLSGDPCQEGRRLPHLIPFALDADWLPPRDTSPHQDGTGIAPSENAVQI